MANRTLIPFVSLLLATACTTPRENTATPAPEDCYACHGNPANNNAAPPPMLGQATPAADAHQGHLQASSWHAAVPCETCHPVPAHVSDPQHIDNNVQVTFTGTADALGATPSYDKFSKTCNGTYCHGATLSGGFLTDPSWTQAGPDARVAACGACHSLPPKENHPPRNDCYLCHGSVVDASLNFIAPEKHVNGHIDYSEGACDTCHGSNGNPAPPVALDGSSATTDLGVGAHRQHLGPSSWHLTVSCSQCHKVPTSVNDPGHVDSPPPAEVIFGTTATAQGTQASWDRTSRTCTVYCHGATLPDDGGTKTKPDWTLEATRSPTCTDCHGTPPGGLHPPRTDCSSCHGDVVDAGMNIIKPELHINGETNVKTITCNLCHGNAAGDPNVESTWAPPVDTHDRTDTSLMSVGTHQQHLAASSAHAQVPCSACHLVPIAVDSPGHIDNDVTITYGFPATANGAPTGFDSSAGTCTNWCHGSGFQTPKTSPVFTSQTGLSCDGCHGFPPATPHTERTDCTHCHNDALIGPNHINGSVDLKAACNQCHGNASADATNPVNWAPPLDAEGNSDPALASVGAHQLHLNGTTQNGGIWHRPVICTDCHKVPTSVTSAGHIDDNVQLTWGQVPTQDGATPSFDTTTATCSGVYCHGSTLIQQGQEVVPTWTASGGAFPTASCGVQCHGFPPALPHPQDAACSGCHSSVIGPSGFVAPELHINGGVDF